MQSTYPGSMPELGITVMVSVVKTFGADCGLERDEIWLNRLGC